MRLRQAKKKIGGKHYCADCYKLDEGTDKYAPKKGGEKMSKILYCGECDKFAYEDVNGYGVCIRITTSAVALISAI